MEARAFRLLLSLGRSLEVNTIHPTPCPLLLAFFTVKRLSELRLVVCSHLLKLEANGLQRTSWRDPQGGDEKLLLFHKHSEELTSIARRSLGLPILSVHTSHALYFI